MTHHKHSCHTIPNVFVQCVDQDRVTSWVKGSHRKEVQTCTQTLTDEEHTVLQVNVTDIVWSCWKGGSFFEGKIKSVKVDKTFEVECCLNHLLSPNKTHLTPLGLDLLQ